MAQGKIIIFTAKRNGYERKIEVAVVPEYLSFYESKIQIKLTEIFNHDPQLGNGYTVSNRRTRRFVYIEEAYKIYNKE